MTASSQHPEAVDDALGRQGLNPNAKIFLAVFLFIGGVVGIVLAVLNAGQQPAATTAAIIYGVVGIVLLVGGFLLIRRRRY